MMELLKIFFENAQTLVEITNGTYQIEHSTKLNKISLKDYVLNSELASMLKENNINNYTINELEVYLKHYENIYKNNLEDISIALYLYKILDEIERYEKMLEIIINYEAKINKSNN